LFRTTADWPVHVGRLVVALDGVEEEDLAAAVAGIVEPGPMVAQAAAAVAGDQERAQVEPAVVGQRKAKAAVV
jgi:hypothetical protein